MMSRDKVFLIGHIIWIVIWTIIIILAITHPGIGSQFAGRPW